MILSKAPEVAALSCDWQNNCVYGVRLKPRSRGHFQISRFAFAEHADWVEAANKVIRELGLNSSIYLVLGFVLDHSEVFECKVPAAAPDVVRDCLRFEVPEHVMSVPEKFRLQYTVCAPADEENMLKVRCAVFPEEELLKFCNQLTKLRAKADALINPLLTLPSELSDDASIVMHGFEKDFCWKNGLWQLAGEDEADAGSSELDDILKKHCSGKLFDDADFRKYRTALCTALFGGRKLFVDSSVQNGVTVLPDYMRPARYRTQLRLMVLLLLMLLGVLAFRHGGAVIDKFSEHRQLVNKVANTRKNVQKMRKQVKDGEKELKDLQRTAELNVGSRNCTGYLGYMSEKLPNEVLITSFRWNEGTLDMSFQSTSTQDMLSFFNRLPGVKIISAPTPRTNQMTNFTTGSVKLQFIEVAEERVKAQLRSLLNSKDKNKKKDKKK